MSKEKLFDIVLPKWPRLAVAGKKITEEQAMTVIIRTDSIFVYMSTNDRDWLKQLIVEMGLKYKKDYPYYDYKEVDKLRAKIKHLGGVEYLCNARVASSYIGGPHGWVDWSGNVFTNNYNIGKWPSVHGIYEEWKLLASEFEFLDLRSQLFNDGGESAVEFVIKDGGVDLIEPVEEMPVIENDFNVNSFANPYRERGCTIEMFRNALIHVMGGNA